MQIAPLPYDHECQWIKQMNYLSSNEIAVSHMESDTQKYEYSIKGLVLRGVISGVMLAMTATRSGAPVSDESIVPIAVVIIMMLGLELLMGSFSVMAKRTNLAGMLRNWLWIVLGNCLGSALYGLFFIASMTTMLTMATTNISDKMIGMAEVKMLAYTAHSSLEFISTFIQSVPSA